MTMDAANRLLQELDGWSFEQGHLVKSYSFPDFAQSLAFVNTVGGIAEEQGHHPEIYLSFGKVALEIWTHAIDGLTESDFILAAKFDAALGPAASPATA